MSISSELAKALHVIVDHTPFREQSVQLATHQAIDAATETDQAPTEVTPEDPEVTHE